jgi:hypothetical protein
MTRWICLILLAGCASPQPLLSGVDLLNFRTAVQTISLRDDAGGAEDQGASTPVPPAPDPAPQAPPAAPVVEQWLVSEDWCRYCPAAKQQFLAEGHSEDHIITIAQARAMGHTWSGSIPHRFSTGGEPVKASVPSRYIYRPEWGTIDLETYSRNCNCAMCRGIRSLQAQYRSQKAEVASRPSQEPTPDAMIDRMLDLMRLQKSDVLVDLGCGDGRILIEAVRRAGCRAIGVEIDRGVAETARASVQGAGMSDQIEIVTGDALEFDLRGRGATAVVTYLYPELLAKLSPRLKSVRLVASPYHRIPGLPMTDHDGVWVYRASDVRPVAAPAQPSPRPVYYYTPSRRRGK